MKSPLESLPVRLICPGCRERLVWNGDGLTAGSGLVFEDGGKHELKGVPDRWYLYRAASEDALRGNAPDQTSWGPAIQ